MPELPRLIAVVGPTAVGKTALAIALAQRFQGEIVNADSRQVYVGMDIGTAKPTAEELEAAPHHLIDIREPDEPLSLGEYLPLARCKVTDIVRREKLPILCGGTGQYVWAFLEGWQVPKVPPDPVYRGNLERRAAIEGLETLWSELKTLDPDRAEAIDRYNTRRIIRALEIVRSLGSRTSVIQRNPEPPYDALIIGLTAERSALYDRIDARFDRMMEDGLLEEARKLACDGYALGDGPLSGVGYSQLGQYLAGELTLEGAVERSKTQTHRLVRRQYTWFKRSDERILWLDATHELPVAEACRHLHEFLGA
jgi:tRNA dimethylallyltransferase